MGRNNGNFAREEKLGKIRDFISSLGKGGIERKFAKDKLEKSLAMEKSAEARNDSPPGGRSSR